MPIGDGIRRNVATISQAERDRLRDAIVQLNTQAIYPGGPTKWAIQDAIHQETHVHGGESFLPWHRELCNRFEALLREVDPELSLHYWDWTTDPRNSTSGVNLMTSAFMGSATGAIGAPFTTFGTVTRDVNNGTPGAPSVSTDASIISSSDGQSQVDQFPSFRSTLEGNHNGVHGFIGGNIGDGHSAFEDPFVFLLHSNVDRLWAMWQAQPGQGWRLDPALTYGTDSTSAGNNGITTALEPWAGINTALRPWAPPENQQLYKTSAHPSVVKPPCYDTMPLDVELAFPTLGAPINFMDVPEGATTVRAAVFSISSCIPVHFEVVNGPGPDFNLVEITQERVWFSYSATVVGAMANGTVTIRCVETEQEWVIPITANTILWPTSASMFVLDKSGSMEWDSGIPGQRRVDVLKFAAPIFVDMMQDNDAIGVVAFDHDAMPAGSAGTVTAAGVPIIGSGRIAAKAAINNHTPNPVGGTSIGDGVELAHSIIDPVGGFSHKSLIVLTDGHETASKYLSDPDISGLINERVYAIGLGTPEQLNPGALSTLAQGSGGYLMMTGDLGIDDIFRLSKYYLQILAGVTNAQIVVDPESSVLPGQVHRIPIQLTDTDFRSDVILLSPAPWAIDFALETPKGDIIDRSSVGGGLPNAIFVDGDSVHYYRLSLPAPIGNGEHEGTWHALLKVDDGNFREYLSTLHQKENKNAIERARAHGVPYSLSAHVRSNLQMNVRVLQDSFEPGGVMTLRALLTESERPVVNQAHISVDIEHPDGAKSSKTLSEIELGVFEIQMKTTITGVYHLVFRGTGKTMRGLPFTREEIRTAAVWKGGDAPPPTSKDDPRGGTEDLCRLLECLFSQKTLGGFYEQFGIDAELVMECFRRYCVKRLSPIGEGSKRNLQNISPTMNQELRELLSPEAASRLINLIDDEIAKTLAPRP